MIGSSFLCFTAETIFNIVEVVYLQYGKVYPVYVDCSLFIICDMLIEGAASEY